MDSLASNLDKMHTVASEEGDVEAASQFTSTANVDRHDIVGTALGSNVCIGQTTTANGLLLDTPSRYAPDIEGSLIPLEHGELAPVNSGWSNNSAEPSFTASLQEPVFDPTQPSSRENATLGNNPMEDKEFADMLDQYRAAVNQLDEGNGGNSVPHDNFRNSNANHDLDGYYSRDLHLDNHRNINQNAPVFAPLYVGIHSVADTQPLPPYPMRPWTDTFHTYPSNIGRSFPANIPGVPYNYHTPFHAQLSEVDPRLSYHLHDLPASHTAMAPIGNARVVEEAPEPTHNSILPLAASSNGQRLRDLSNHYDYGFSHDQLTNANDTDQHSATSFRHNSVASRASLSEGELSQQDDSHEGDSNIDDGYLSDGEVEFGEGQLTPLLVDSTEEAQTQNLVASDCDDVTAIVKQRLADMLQLRDPKLLQAPEFRGLMLLLKCIKLDDPEEIYSHIKKAPSAVASELNILAHEFGLCMISDACVNVVLASNTGAADAAMGTDMSAMLAATNSTFSMIGNSVASTQNGKADSAQSPSSDEVDMDTQASSASSRGSSPEIDMDTSSDIGYDSASVTQEPLQGDVDDLAEAISFAQPPPSTPNTDAFSRQLRFSRSCAPSPPSFHPRTPRYSAPGSRLSALRDTSDIPRTMLGAAVLPELAETRDIDDVSSESGAVSRPLSFNSRPPSTSRVSELVDKESLVCNNEQGHLVAFIDEGSSQLGSDSGSDSDVEDNGGRVSDRLIRHNEILHKANVHIKQHGQERVGDISNGLRTQSSASLPSPNHSGAATPALPKAPVSIVHKGLNATLQRAKLNLKEKEAAIAELKLQISRRQAQALLQKKQRQSKQHTEHLPNSTASASNTPPVVGNHAGVFMPDAQISKATIQNTASEPAKTDAKFSSEEAVDETSNVDAGSTNGISALVGASDSAAAQYSDFPVGSIRMSGLHLCDTPLPRSVCDENTLAKVTSEVRLKHMADVSEYLSDAADTKRTALKYVTHRSTQEDIAAAASQDLYAQTPGLFAERRLRLTQKRNTVYAHISRLQAELGLAKTELSCIDYNIQTSHECERLFSMDDVTFRSQGSNSKLAAALDNDICEIQKLRNTMPSTIESHAIPPSHETSLQAHKQSPPPPPLSLQQKIKAQSSEVHSGSATSGKSKAAELKSKLLAMKKDQSTMAQRLEGLAEKRKQQTVVASTNKVPKKKQKINSPISTTSTKIGEIRNMFSNAIWTKAGLYERWCKEAVSFIDNALLQPLFLVDGVGVSSAVVPSINANAQAWDADPITEQSGTSVYSIISAPPAAEASLDKAKYARYESPLGGIATTNGFSQPTKDNGSILTTHPTTCDLENLTTEHLLAAINIPVQQSSTLKQYYREVFKALHVFAHADKDTNIPNVVIARVLLPVWNYYKHMLPMRGIVPENPLYNVLGLANINLSDAGAELDLGASKFNKEITIKEAQLLGRLLNKGEQFLPILNHDVACIPASYKTRREGGASVAHSGRYFDACVGGDNSDEDGEVCASSADSDSDSGSSADSDTDKDDAEYTGAKLHAGVRESGEESDSRNTASPRSQDAARAFYQRAIRALWRGAPKLKRPIRVYDICTYLNTKANASLGKIILSLKRALQDWPDSEELWDLYLELYTRQRPPAEDILAAFSDATRLHPSSVCLWRRYAYWCGYNVFHSKKSFKAANSWQMRLSTATAAAIQYLSNAQTSQNAEHISAAIAELLIYFWECSWGILDIIGAASRHQEDVPTPEQLKPQLLAHMCACLCAVSNSILFREISTMRTATMGNGYKKTLITAWDCTEWTLAKLLLPQHLLLVGQVFVSAFINTEFIPRMVSLQIYTMLQAPTDHQTTYYIDLDKITGITSAGTAGNGSLKPYIVSILCKLFGGVLQVLNKLNEPDWSSNFNTQSLVASRSLCLASINTSLVFLRRQHPKALESHQIDCEQIFWRIRVAKAGSPDIRCAVDAMTAMGVYKFLLVSQALCKGTFPGNGYEVADAAAMLWMHAVHVAEGAGVDVAGLKSFCERHAENVNDGGGVSTDDDETLRQKIADARTLYYRIIGYTSAYPPISLRVLAQNMDHDTTLNAFHKQIHESAGVWTNLALLELIYASYCLDGGSASVKQSVESALLWLHFGLEQISVVHLGARAQIWAVLFRLCMTQRSLVTRDIVEMHHDLGGGATNAKSLHRSSPCFAYINFVLYTVLQNSPSDGTLGSIGNYLSSTARQNSELAIRIFEYVWARGRLPFDMCSIVRQMSYLSFKDA